MEGLNGRSIGQTNPLHSPYNHNRARNFLLKPWRLKDGHGGNESQYYGEKEIQYFLARIVDSKYKHLLTIGYQLNEPFWNKQPWYNEANDLYLVALVEKYDEVLYHIPISVAHYIKMAK